MTIPFHAISIHSLLSALQAGVSAFFSRAPARAGFGSVPGADVPARCERIAVAGKEVAGKEVDFEMDAVGQG